MRSENSFIEDLIGVLDSVAVLSDHEYEVSGVKKSIVCDNIYSRTGRSRSNIADELAKELYTTFYCRPLIQSNSLYDTLAYRDHVAALSRANLGTGTWECGWRIVRVISEDEILVRNDKVIFWVGRKEIDSGRGTTSAGASCRVRVGKERTNFSPGYYMAIGNGIARARSSRSKIVRLYWNLRLDAAVEYISAVTNLLNQENIPFRTKVISDPNGYIRADAGVLYLNSTVLREAMRHIETLYSLVKGGLRDDVPLFTKRLAPGLGLAEDPGSGLSFGQSRCNLIAHGLWDAFMAAARSDERLEHVIVFMLRGLVNPKLPYLSHNTIDRYRALRIL